MFRFILFGWESTLRYNRHSEDYFSNRNEIFQTKLKVSLLSLSTHHIGSRFQSQNIFLLQFGLIMVLTRNVVGSQATKLQKRETWYEYICLPNLIIKVSFVCKSLNFWKVDCSWFQGRYLQKYIMFLLTFLGENITLLILQRYPIMRSAMFSFGE